VTTVIVSVLALLNNTAVCTPCVINKARCNMSGQSESLVREMRVITVCQCRLNLLLEVLSVFPSSNLIE
jgi:hypothetical protein